MAKKIDFKNTFYKLVAFLYHTGTKWTFHATAGNINTVLQLKDKSRSKFTRHSVMSNFIILNAKTQHKIPFFFFLHKINMLFFDARNIL